MSYDRSEFLAIPAPYGGDFAGEKSRRRETPADRGAAAKKAEGSSSAGEAPRRDLAHELETWSDEPARAWKPEPGEVLVGELLAYRQGQGAYGPAWVAHVREEGSGELRAVWLFHAVALDEFRRLRPKPGERVGLRLLEDGGKAGARYRRFALVVDRPVEAEVPDFEALAPASDAGNAAADAGGQGATDAHTFNPFD